MLSELIRQPAEYMQALKENRLGSLLEPYLKATDYFILVPFADFSSLVAA